jgi:YD repeat-containing protein
MTKGLSGAVKRNRIANYMASLPEEFEVIEDNLIGSEPVIELQTKSRIIKLSCDEKGNVVEDFSMREGAGSKEDFLLKQEAYNALRQYYNDYYTGARIKQSSFEDGILKIELADRTVTLTYDANSKSVEEADRAKRKPKEVAPKVEEKKPDTSGQISLFDLQQPEPKKAKEVKEVKTPEAPKTEKIPEITIKPEVEKAYSKMPEGVSVKNVCNNKVYKVKKDQGNIIQVFDKDYGYLVMARADLEIVESESE